MLKAVVDYKTCGSRACARCPARSSCDTGAIIKIDADEPAAVDAARCLGCGDCLEDCPVKAITLVES